MDKYSLKKYFTPGNLILILIVFLGALVRINAVFVGDPPLLTINEEGRIVGMSRDIILMGDLNPHYFNYPSFLIYAITIINYGIYFFTGLFSSISNFNDVDMHAVFVLDRLLVVMLSLATIILTYKTGRRLFNRESGIIAAAFLALSLLHLKNSSIISVDAPMVFWVMLAYYFMVRIFYGDARTINYLLAGIFTGVAVSTKYNAFLVFIPLLLVHILRHKDLAGAVKDKKIWLSSLLVVAAFIAVTPYSIFDYEWFLFGLQFESIHYRVGHLGAESADVSYLYYLKTIMKENSIIFFLLAVFGIYTLTKEGMNKTIIFLAFPVIYFLFIGGFRVHFARNITVLMPFIAMLSGYAVYEIWKIIKGYPKWQSNVRVLMYGTLLLIVFFVPARNSLSYWQKINMNDTRLLAKNWIEQNLADDSRILQESYTAKLDGRFEHTAYTGLLGKYTKPLDGFEYIIVSSGNYERIMKDDSRSILRDNYVKVFEEFTLVKEFPPDNKNSIGPTVRIYRNETQLPPQ